MSSGSFAAGAAAAAAAASRVQMSLPDSMARASAHAAARQAAAAAAAAPQQQAAAAYGNTAQQQYNRERDAAVSETSAKRARTASDVSKSCIIDVMLCYWYTCSYLSCRCCAADTVCAVHCSYGFSSDALLHQPLAMVELKHAIVYTLHLWLLTGCQPLIVCYMC
jgi:hypothetical protein